MEAERARRDYRSGLVEEISKRVRGRAATYRDARQLADLARQGDVEARDRLIKLGLDLHREQSFLSDVAPLAVDDPDFERATYALILLDDGCRAFLREASLLREPSCVLTPEYQTAATVVLDFSVAYLRAAERFIFGERVRWPRRITRRIWCWLRRKDHRFMVWTPGKEWEIRPTPGPPRSIAAQADAAARNQSR